MWKSDYYYSYLKILRRFRLCLFVLYWLLDKTGGVSFVLIYCAEGSSALRAIRD